MNTKLVQFCAAAMVVCGISSGADSAYAQDSGWYLGGAIGRSKVDIDTSALAADLTALGLGNTGVSSDDTGTGWKIFAGYNFNKYFGIEGGFLDLGRFDARTTVTSVLGTPITPTPVSATIKFEESFFLSAVGTVPLSDKFSIFGKLGFYSMKTQLDVAVGGVRVDDSARNEDLVYGLGLGFNITKNVGLRAEWERFNKVGNADRTGEGDVDLLSIGLLYRF